MCSCLLFVADLRVRAAGPGAYVRVVPAELAPLLEVAPDRSVPLRAVRPRRPGLLARRAAPAPRL